MLDFISRLMKSKAFHTLMLIITATVEEFLRGTVSLHTAGLVIAASVAGIFFVNALKKVEEAVLGRLGVSAEMIGRIEDLAEQEVSAQIHARQGLLMSHLAEHGVDQKTAEQVVSAFASSVAKGEQGTAVVTAQVTAEANEARRDKAAG